MFWPFKKSREQKPFRKRVVITGIGIVSPIGIGVEAFWQNLLKGANGVGPITLFDASSHKCKIAAEVRNWDAESQTYLSDNQRKYFSRMTQFAVVAAKLAMKDAGLVAFPDKTDVLVGVGAEAHAEIRDEMLRVPGSLETFTKKINPLMAIKAMVFAPSAAIALDLATQGKAETISSACASAFSSLYHASQSIRTGDAEIVLCGGSETPVSWMMMSALSSARMLTDREDPADALRPLDKDRDKSTTGEGAGIFIMEDYDRAVKRGARIYGELIDYAQGQENINEFFMSDRSGSRWAKVIKAAATDRKIDLINAHAPSDTTLDKMEADAIRSGLEDNTEQIPVTSIKASIGSGLAVTGALQTAASLLMLHHQRIVPTRNYAMPDGEIGLAVVPGARARKINYILQNAKALGGSDSAMVLGRVP